MRAYGHDWMMKKMAEDEFGDNTSEEKERDEDKPVDEEW